MKVVIDIDEIDYRWIKNECVIPIKIDTHIYEAIRNGTVLQQGEWIKETPLREICPFCKAIRTDYRHVYCGVCGAYLGGDRSGTENNRC